MKHPTLGFGSGHNLRFPSLGSGHDLTFLEFKPRVGLCVGSVEPAWDSLSLSLSLSFKINKAT